MASGDPDLTIRFNAPSAARGSDVDEWQIFRAAPGSEVMVSNSLVVAAIALSTATPISANLAAAAGSRPSSTDGASADRQPSNSDGAGAGPPPSKPDEENPILSSVDNRITIAHTFQATGPGHWSRNPDGTINGKTEKQAYSLTHLDVWDYGTNYLDISIYKSGNNDPAASCINAGVTARSDGTAPRTPSRRTCHGQTEVYVLLRSTFAWSKIFDTKAFAEYPLKDVSFEVGLDANHQNDYNGAAKRAVVAGLRFDFELPYKGTLKVAPLIYYEFANHSRFMECEGGQSSPASAGLGVSCTVGGRKRYRPTWSIETAYNVNLETLDQTLKLFAISGRATFRGPKGNQNAPLGGTSGGAATKLEINSEPVRVSFDAGKALGASRRSHQMEVWVAYRYWRNKFGLDANASPTCFTNIAGQGNGSCTESSISTGVTVKL